MTLFKCKMCGGTLEIDNETVAICEYCGTQQTLPKLNDDRRANLYDRANHFRRNNEFDKAMGIYEQILNEDNTDAESYWSLVLCRYGIEYVEDPATRKRVPTVNRAQFTSIFDDDNYKSALQYADGAQRHLYEEEAKTINEIQKGILAISQKEEPFDVFICYKETDHNGRRTVDSVLANELYHQLTQEGFHVFFSRITLEDKLGTAYEPYIFAALNSAKVMVAFGTKPEYFNAVWVKNEWSRYLALIKSGAKKTLIPAYRDMDPYDLPDEFSHLQAQDMSKLGFMQDLIRGIRKITQKEDSKRTVVRETVITAANTNIAPLLKRAFMFLEDSEWDSASEYCERVLDNDPECAEAYLGKLMAELHVCKQDDLKDCKYPFDDQNNYQKAIRFANAPMKDVLHGYIDYINERNENARLEGIYSRAKAQMEQAKEESTFKEAAQLFESVSHYKDAASLAQECYEQMEIARKDALYHSAKALMARDRSENYREAIKQLEKIGRYKDAAALIQECNARAEALEKNAVYNAAKILMTGNRIANYQEAIERFETIAGWKDAEDQIEVCHNKIAELETQTKRRSRKTEVRKKIVKILSAVCACIVAAAVLIKTLIIPLVQYNKAISKMEAGQYEEAIVDFEALGGFRDAEQQILACQDGINENIYQEAIALMAQEAYDDAQAVLQEIEDYKDSRQLISDCKELSIDRQYNGAVKLMNAGKYEEAKKTFQALNGHKDSDALIQKCDQLQLEEKQTQALKLIDSKKYKDALVLLLGLQRSGLDVRAEIQECDLQILEDRKTHEKPKIWKDFYITNGKETGTETVLSPTTIGDIKVHKLTRVALDNGCVRFTLDCTVPKSSKISVFDPPYGNQFMYMHSAIPEGRKTFTFDVKSSDLAEVFRMSIQFGYTYEDHCVVVIDNPY